jgi:DNA mismatch endonuclease (patch repair protein)
MVDVFPTRKRSEVMSRIRSRGNKDTELVLAKIFRTQKISGWRRHALLKFQTPSSKFQVRPDFVFRQVRLALFVDGCFWHGCPRHATKPKNNAAFWRRKLAANKRRDALVTRTLRRSGWRVVRIWECDLHRATKKARRSTPHPGPLPGRGGEGEEFFGTFSHG